ncbi:MAG: hypothetical protein FJ087_00305 [Deltaproteobacteria bacterium]|nr:hypothetical protein [Deltaproteobacteria bacterium]
MAPRLDTVLDVVPPGDPAAVVARVPRDRRHRLVLAWPGAAADPPIAVIRAARAAGFARIRLRAPAADLREAPLLRAVEAGLDEVEAALPGDGDWGAIAALRTEGRLRHVAVASSGTGNPCAADEVVLPAARAVPSGFRLAAVRGAPLCLVPGLSPDRVVSNAWTASGPGPALDLPTEDPGRAYFAPCDRCSLLLACDGVPLAAFRHAGGRGEARRETIRAFGTGEAAEVERSPEGLLARVHLPTRLSGRVHLAAVATGVRPCGRVVVPAGRAERQADLIRRLGLHAEVIPPEEAPPDLDPGATGAPSAAHVFLSRDPVAVREAAGVERAFAAGRGSGAMQPDEFARRIGRALGYPDCCVEAFVEAGRLATTADLLRAAHARSRAFRWELDCLDPLSPVTLVPHVPCRFDCGPSLDLARRVLAVALPAVHPFLDGSAARLLARDARLYPDGGVVTSDADGGRPDSPSLRPGRPIHASVRAALPAMLRDGVAGAGEGAVLFAFGG